MSKIKIRTTINEQEYETNGIKNNNTIIYQDKDILVKILLENYLYLIRENDEYKLELDFKKNSAIYNLKKYNKTINLKIEKKQIKINKNNIKIEYIINDELIKFNLEYEEI